MGDVTNITGLGNAIGELEKREQEVNAQGAVWAKNFEELTGYPPGKPLTAFDVVKIMHRLYGEPKND